MRPSRSAGTGSIRRPGWWRRSKRGAWRWCIPARLTEKNDDLSDISRFILIDGTWHEARKIHQRSPYLQKARRVCLKPTGESRYNLRKNQKEACLCTAECVIDILRSKGEMEQAERLQERFLSFIRPPGLMRGANWGSDKNP